MAGSSRVGARVDARVERTRAQLLTAARALLETEGSKAVTPQRLTSTTGISRSTIHRHWPDMRTLIIDAIARPAPGPDLPILGNLRLDIGVDLHNLRLALNNRQIVTVLLSLFGESEVDEGFRGAIRTQTGHFLGRLRRVLENARTEGTLERDLDVELAIVGLAGPLFFRRLVFGEELTAHMTDAVIDGFLRAHAPA